MNDEAKKHRQLAADHFRKARRAITASEKTAETRSAKSFKMMAKNDEWIDRERTKLVQRTTETHGCGNVTYYVSIGFARNDDGSLVALMPVEAHSSAEAIAEARALAARSAGAIAFARTGNTDIGKFEEAEILWQAGEVPVHLL